MTQKFEESFTLACEARRDESIDVQHQRFRIKTKFSYLFEDHSTDRRTQFQNVLSKTFQMIYE